MAQTFVTISKKIGDYGIYAPKKLKLKQNYDDIND